MERSTIHYFDNTHDAYDATQMGTNLETDEEVKWFDILICLEEKAVGLSDTWPIAVTEDHGQLHTVKDEYVEKIGGMGEMIKQWASNHARWDHYQDAGWWIEYGTRQMKLAVDIAKALGFKVRQIHI